MTLREFIENKCVTTGGIIYKIQNLINNKVYIGQTRIQLLKRLRKHISDSNSNTKSRKHHLQRAINKYGLDSFDICVLENCSIEDLNSREQFWIKFFNSTDPDLGYNCTNGGDSFNSEKRITQKTRQLLSEAHKKRWSDPEYRKKQSISREHAYDKMCKAVVQLDYNMKVINLYKSKRELIKHFRLDPAAIKHNYPTYSYGYVFMLYDDYINLDLSIPFILKLNNNFEIIDNYYSYKDAQMEAYKLAGRRVDFKKWLNSPRNKRFGCKIGGFKWMLYSNYISYIQAK